MTAITTTKRRRIVRPHARRLGLRRYFLSMNVDSRHQFLQAAQTSAAYVQQIYGGWCLCAASVAQRIENATSGKIPAWSIRPDLYDRPVVVARSAI